MASDKVHRFHVRKHKERWQALVWDIQSENAARNRLPELVHPNARSPIPGGWVVLASEVPRWELSARVSYCRKCERMEECDVAQVDVVFALGAMGFVPDMGAMAKVGIQSLVGEVFGGFRTEQVTSPFPRVVRGRAAVSREPRREPVEQLAARELGLAYPCTREALARAWRRAAFERHPDRAGSSPEALARFKRASDAHEILRRVTR